ncbi:hypothetical protein BaRGS_00036859, partial [Batillaria attramentaria]
MMEKMKSVNLPEVIRKHLATLSTLYTNTIGIVRRDQDGSYTRDVCHRFKEIQKACEDFKSSLCGKDKRQKKTAAERLVKTGIIDLLCDVIVEGLESDNRSVRDDDTTDSPLHIAADILDNTFYPPSDYREVCCRVRDDVRLLPVLVNKLRDWYRPHMDNTLTESQGVLLWRCLGIIVNIAQSDDKGRERLRQLGTTDVMLLYLASADYDNMMYAALTLAHIVTEEETSRLPTDFVNIVCDAARTWRGLGEALLKNDVIGRALIQNGIVDILMDRVRQTDDEDDKAGYLNFLYDLVTAKREHLAESTAQGLLCFACSVYGASPPIEPDSFYEQDQDADGDAVNIIFTLFPGLKKGPRFKFYQLILRSCEFDQRGAEASETGGKRKGNVSSSREANHSPPHSRSTSPVSPLCLLPASKDLLKLLDDAEATKDYVLLLKKLVSNRHGDLSERTKKDILCSACLTFGTAPASEIGREVDWDDDVSAIINKLSPDLHAEPRFKVYEVILSQGGFEQQESEDEDSEKIRKRKKSSDSSMDESDSPPHSRSTSPVSPLCLLPASKDLLKLLDDADATDVYLSLLLRLVSQKSEDLPESTKDDIFRSVWLSVGSTMAIELHGKKCVLDDTNNHDNDADNDHGSSGFTNGLGVVLQRDDVIGRTQIHNGIADILMDRVRQTDEKRDKAQLILRSCEFDQRGAETSETRGKRKGKVSSSREENHSPPHSPSTCPVSPFSLLPASEDLLKLLDDAGATNDYVHLLKKLVSNRHGDLSERTKKDILCSACLMFGMAPASEIETDDLVFFYPTADEIAKAIIRKLSPDLHDEPRFKVYVPATLTLHVPLSPLCLLPASKDLLKLLDDADATNGSELTGNDVIVRVLLERGVVSGLMERVRKTYNVQKSIVSREQNKTCGITRILDHIMPPSVKQELLDLAVAVYRGHISIGRLSCRDLAKSILAALRDDLERAPTHRQLCLGTGLDFLALLPRSVHTMHSRLIQYISEPPTKRTATPLTDRQELSSTSTWHPPTLPSALSLTHYASSSSLPSSHPPQGSSPHNSLSECHRVPTQSAPHPASLPPVFSQLSSSQHSASQVPQPSCLPSTVPVSTVSVSGHRQHLGSTATAVGTSLDLSSLQPVHPIRRLPVHQHPSSSFTQPLTSAPFSRAVFPALPFPQQTSTPAQFLPAPFSVVPLPQQFPPSQMSMSQLQSSAQFDPSHFSSTSRDPAPLSDGPQPASFLSLLQSSSSPQDLSSQFPPPVDIASDPLPTQSTLAPPQSASWSQWRSSPRSSGQHAPLSPTLQIPDSPSGYVQLPAPPQPYDDMPCVDSTNRSSPPVEPDHGLSVVVSDHGNRQVSGCVPESAPWSTGNDVLMRNMETRIRDLEEQNVQYQEQNVQYQEQNVQYQERLANLEDERKRLVQSNNDLKEELEGYKERSSEVDEERRKYQEKIRDLEQEQNRWREKTRELGEEHTRYIAKNRALEEEGRKQRGKCRQLRKVASSARENSSSSAPVTDPGPSTSQERSVTGPSTSQERSVTGPSTSQESNVTGPSTSQERNDGERKAGVYTQSEAENYGMVPLETDHPVYLYESQLQDAVYASRSNRVPCDGTRLARRLLHVFFTVEERRVGSISDTPKPGLVRLDKTVVDAIL